MKNQYELIEIIFALSICLIIICIYFIIKAYKKREIKNAIGFSIILLLFIIRMIPDLIYIIETYF